MIKKVSFKKLPGYLGDIKALKSKFVFKPGLNVIMGDNGCGKSTLLKLLACLTGSSERIKPWEPLSRSIFKKQELGIFNAIVGEMVKWDGNGFMDSAVDLKWTGMKTVYYHAPTSISMPGAVYDMDDLNRVWQSNSMSSGQGIMSSFNRFMSMVKSEMGKLAEKKVNDAYNDVWQGTAKRWNQWIKENVKKCKPLLKDNLITVLADEPDSHLSIRGQAEFWGTISQIDWEKANIQAIFVSHSCVTPAKIPEDRIINMTPGFSSAICDVMKQIYSK